MVRDARGGRDSEPRDDPGRDAGVRTVRFDVEGVGRRRVLLRGGRVEMPQGRAEAGDTEADCIIGCSEADFGRILTGEQNLVTALMQGRVSVSGDLEVAQRLHSALRSMAYQAASGVRHGR